MGFLMTITVSCIAEKVAKIHTKPAEYEMSINDKVSGKTNNTAPVILFAFNHVFATTLLLRSPLPNYYQLSLASSKSANINNSKLSATGYTSKLSNPQLTIFPLSLSKQ